MADLCRVLGHRYGTRYSSVCGGVRGTFCRFTKLVTESLKETVRRGHFTFKGKLGARIRDSCGAGELMSIKKQMHSCPVALEKF